MRRILSLFAVLALLYVPACTNAPPTLTPAGIAAYRGTQAIQSLDLLRDAAIAANALTPPPKEPPLPEPQYGEMSEP